MTRQLQFSPHFTNLLQIALTWLILLYMLLIGGSFAATVEYRIQLLNASVAIVMAFVWLTYRLWKREGIQFPTISIPVAIFVGSQWIAASTSLQPRLSWEQAMATTTWALTFLFVSDLLFAGWPKQHILNALTLAAIIITGQALWDVINWFFAWLSQGSLPSVVYRVTGFLGHPNLTAASINLLLPIIIYRAIKAVRLRERITFIALITGMLLVEFFTSSRSGWIGAAVLLVTLPFVALAGPAWQNALRTITLRWQALPSALRTVAVVSGLVLAGIGGWVLWQQTNHPTHPEFFESRQYIWGPAWQMFLQQPLTGTGPGMYTWFYPSIYSIPPNWLSPHAHSLPLQILAESGLAGLLSGLFVIGAGAFQLYKQWKYTSDKWWLAAIIAGYAGFLVHHLFDYLFGTPAFTFLFVIFSALAFTSEAPLPKQRTTSPVLTAIPVIIVAGFAIYSLRAAALNDRALLLASNDKWQEAAMTFSQAAENDPGVTVYWENAALAWTRSGNINQAIAAWQRAATDDLYWAVPAANLAILQKDPEAMKTALTLAPGSDLLVLNIGALSEATGDSTSARMFYTQALTLRPSLANALYWQQSALRQDILALWQKDNIATPTSLQLGELELRNGQPRQAIEFFEQAMQERPLSNLPYIALARAYLAINDTSKADYYLQAGKLIPVITPDETLPIYEFEGDLADVNHERDKALDAYVKVFSIINDYTMAGPGTYGFPQRYWYVYHRNALPSDLVPQFTRADISAEMDIRVTKLAGWLIEDGEQDKACYVLNRVRLEAPISSSGEMWRSVCQS